MRFYPFIAVFFACWSYEVQAASSPETTAARTYFYVGGQYVNVGQPLAWV